MIYPSIEDTIGHTPLVQIKHLNPNNSNVLLAKLEGNNPAGSVKDRAAFNMIFQAEKRGEIKPGDTLIEATSGNTGIALAMVAAIKGYEMIVIMPDNLSQERQDSMTAYGAKLILVTEQQGMEGARDLALEMQDKGQGIVLNQFANEDNPTMHIITTAQEIDEQTNGEVSHLVSSMGTTGTIMGASRYFKQKGAQVQIVGVQPKSGEQIPGIRRWPQDYLPKFYNASEVDMFMDVSLAQAEEMTRQLARKEGIFAGISSGGAMAMAVELSKKVNNATIVTIICDRGDRYLSTGVFTTV